MVMVKQILAVSVSMVLVSCFFIVTSSADTIHLTNGREIEGRIIKEDAELVELELLGGIVKFRKSQIKEIKRDSEIRGKESGPKNETGFPNETFAIGDNVPESIRQPIMVLHANKIIFDKDAPAYAGYTQDPKEYSKKGLARQRALEALRDEIEAGTDLDKYYELMIPLLIDALADTFSQNSWVAESALKKIGQPAALSLISCLKDENESSRRLHKFAYVVRTMNTNLSDVRIRGKVVIPPESVPDLVDALRNNYEYTIRSEILMAMDLIEDGRALGGAVPDFIAIIKNPDPPNKAYGLRSDCFKLLSKVDDEKALAPAVPVLVEILEGKYAADFRPNAMSLLFKAGQEGIKALIKELEDPDRDIQKKTTDLLLTIRNKEYIPVLIAALDEKNNSVRTNVLFVLQELTGRRFNADSKKWKAWWDKEKEIIELRWHEPALNERLR